MQSDASAPFGFTPLGSGVADGSVSPLQAQVDASQIAPWSEPAMSAFLVAGDYAYLYRCAPGSQLGSGWFPCIVGRSPLATAGHLSAYQYFVTGSGYTGGVAGASLVVEGAPGFSITWNAFLGKYLLVYIEPFATELSARTADTPDGPFSDKVSLWPCTLPPDDVGSFCYLAYEHPELETGDGKVVTVSYSTNSTSFSALSTHPDLYWPRMVQIDLSTRGL